MQNKTPNAVLLYGQFPDLAGQGAVGFRLIFEQGAKLHAEDSVKLIETMNRFTTSMPRVVSIEGKINSQNFTASTESPELSPALYSLCTVLKDYGYRIRVVGTGVAYPQWFKLADVLAIYVTQPLQWLKFRATVVVYRPPRGILTEPDLPTQDQVSWLYLDGDLLGEGEIQEFFVNARRLWFLHQSFEPTFTQEVFSV